MNQKQVLFQFSWRNPNEALLLWNWGVGFEGWITGTIDSVRTPEKEEPVIKVASSWIYLAPLA